MNGTVWVPTVSVQKTLYIQFWPQNRVIELSFGKLRETAPSAMIKCSVNSQPNVLGITLAFEVEQLGSQPCQFANGRNKAVLIIMGNDPDLCTTMH